MMASLFAAIGGLFASFGPVVDAVQQLTAKPTFLDHVAKIVNQIIVPIANLFK